MKLFHKVVALATTAVIVGFVMSTRAQVSPSPKQLTLSAINLKHKTGPMKKVGSDLALLHAASQVANTPAPQANTRPSKLNRFSSPVRGDKVVVDAVASGDPAALLADLKKLGLQQASTYGSVVSGLLPIKAIDKVAQLNSLQFARPAYAIKNVGLTTSQGVPAMRAGVARRKFGVNGTGVTVGVLSDSFNNLGGAAADVRSGDLPAGIKVLSDLPEGGIDEGRAMMQLVHDVAPGANLAFHTAFLGRAGFANGILRLANKAKAKVIVDDVGYFDEPFFQDGIIAQAVDSVFAQGVSYFSAAGNNARNSYESAFKPSGQSQPVGEFHDFNPGPQVDVTQSITVPPDEELFIVLQWDSPFFSVSPSSGGSPNDLDVYLVDEAGLVLTESANVNIGGDAVEILYFRNRSILGEPGTKSKFNLVIVNFEDPNPGLMKYIWFGSRGVRVNEFNTASGTVYGHPNARGAEAVGAAFYRDTPAFSTNPAVLESYSSAEPTPILFDTAGNRLRKPRIRRKPEIVAPDGTNTTFFFPGDDIEGDGFPNFFGTSAAAPHAAAVAALMLDAAPRTSPRTIYATLERTALDMNDPGFDFDSGFGFIQAERALRALLKSNNSHK